MVKTTHQWLLTGVLTLSGLGLALEGMAHPLATLANRKPYAAVQGDNERVKLITVLTELNNSRGIYFLLSEQTIGNQLVAPIKETKGDIEKLLNKLLAESGLTYKKVNDKTYVILAEKQDQPVAQTNNQRAVNPNDYAANLSIDPIKGKVTGPDGSPASGASVVVKGSNKGTTTNANGEFTIDAKAGDILVISGVGMETTEKLATGDLLVISLKAANGTMQEVVVTALGVQRKSKSLTYATQKVSGAELSTVRDANVINGLAGKAAGVQINRSASGVGGSARVVLRGNKSTRENQPLYVIDGVPMANFSPAQPTDVWGQSSGSGSAGRDGGDGISNINPDDIESINILKGASAAALYGSQAANGVILITTKKGKAGSARIDFSSNLLVENPLNSTSPELQYRYGQTTAPTGNTTGTAESWGGKVNALDHAKDFFRTGTTWTNSLGINGGTTNAQTYFSYSNTASKGILPTNTFDRHNLNLRETLKMLNDKLTVDANVNFITQQSTNRAVSGMYNNPLTGLYLMPRGQNFAGFADNFEILSNSRNLMTQNWWNINTDKGWGGNDDQQNPYWALARNIRQDKRDRVMGNLRLNYQINKVWSVQARGNFDRSEDKYELKSYASTQAVLAGSNGRYTLEKATNQQLYGDLIAFFNTELNSKLTLNGNLGTSITDLKGNDRVFFDADPQEGKGLEYANKFFVSNIRPNALIAAAGMDRRQTQSVFGSANFGYDGKLFVDLTARNDWSSTFAFTPTMNKGFFYYSAGLTAVLSDMISLPAAVSFWKARASYAKVGNDIPPYITRPAEYTVSTSNGQVNLVKNTKAPYPGIYMKPEDNRSFELGTEIRFLENRVGLDVTYYINNNFDQYIEVPAPLGSGYSAYYLNLGNIQNKGVEAMLTVVPVKQKNLTWTANFNFSSNKNLIKELSNPNIPGAGPDNVFILTPFGVNMFGSVLKEGGQWGDIYGNKIFKRDGNGNMVVDADGTPQTENTAGTFLGNLNPKFLLGWNNQFDINKFHINFLIDGRFGGKVMDVTQSVIDFFGVSEASAAARDNGGVTIPNAVLANGNKYTGTTDARKYYTAIGSRSGVGEAYMYDATNIRLRELAIGYNFGAIGRVVKDARVSVVGRNLFFFKNDAPFDPELSMSTGNGLQGVNVFGLPATRSLGVNVKFTF